MSATCSPPPTRPAAAATPPSWVGWRGSGRILLIDDDASIRTAVARSVAKLGFTVEDLPDGRQALARFEADPGRYALVILDFKLPGMDGAEVAGRLRGIMPDVRLVFMSGLSRQEALDELDGLGTAGFLQKPFTLSGLVTELRSALDA